MVRTPSWIRGPSPSSTRGISHSRVTSHEELTVKSRSSRHGPHSILDPWPKPVLYTRHFPQPRHLTSGRRLWQLHHNPPCSGYWARERVEPFLSTACFSQPKSRSTRPDPTRPAKPCGLSYLVQCPRQVALSLAPFGTTPSVTKRHKAMRSFLANATMATRRRRPRSDRTRSWNQRLSAVSG